MRLKIFHNLKYEINKKKITHIFLDLDVLSLQSIILLVYSLFRDLNLYYFSNENNILNEHNFVKKLIKKIYIKFYILFLKKKYLEFSVT